MLMFVNCLVQMLQKRGVFVFFLHGWSNILTHWEYNILTKWLSYLEAYKYKGISWYGEKLRVIYVQISNKKLLYDFVRIGIF